MRKIVYGSVGLPSMVVWGLRVGSGRARGRGTTVPRTGIVGCDGCPGSLEGGNYGFISSGGNFSLWNSTSVVGFKIGSIRNKTTIFLFI